jgi:general secretion pathway protein G
MRFERPAEDGFSLLELLVVTVVLGIVSSISLVSLFGALDRSKQRATMADMRTIGRALEAYNVDNSGLPDDSGGLGALIDDLVPFVADTVPLQDHWGHDYGYIRDGTSYSLMSYGKDGLDGSDIDSASVFDFTRDIVMFNGIFVAAPE